MALAACTLPPAAVAEPISPNAAVLLVTVADWPSAGPLAAEAARRAGVPVLQARALSPRTYALTLACASDADCQQAMARLAADSGFAVEVQPDRRRRLPQQPSPSSSK